MLALYPIQSDMWSGIYNLVFCSNFRAENMKSNASRPVITSPEDPTTLVSGLSNSTSEENELQKIPR